MTQEAKCSRVPLPKARGGNAVGKVPPILWTVLEEAPTDRSGRSWHTVAPPILLQGGPQNPSSLCQPPPPSPLQGSPPQPCLQTQLLLARALHGGGTGTNLPGLQLRRTSLRRGSLPAKWQVPQRPAARRPQPGSSPARTQLPGLKPESGQADQGRSPGSLAAYLLGLPFRARVPVLAGLGSWRRHKGSQQNDPPILPLSAGKLRSPPAA